MSPSSWFKAPELRKYKDQMAPVFLLHGGDLAGTAFAVYLQSNVIREPGFFLAAPHVRLYVLSFPSVNIP
jgi:hypothetical protein